MSSIGPNIPGAGVVPAPTTPVVQPPTGAPAPTVPTYLQNFALSTSATALGLAAPRNLGDIEALFAEIASKLDVTRNETDDNEIVATTEAKRTEVARLSSLITMVANFGAIVSVERELEEPARLRGEAAAARDAAQNDADNYQQNIAALDNGSVSDLGFNSVSGRALRGSIPYETGQRAAAADRLTALTGVPQGNWPPNPSLSYFESRAPALPPGVVAAAYIQWQQAGTFLANAQAERAELVNLRAQALETVETQQAEFERWDAVAAPLEARISAARSAMPSSTQTDTGSTSFFDLMLFFAALLPAILGLMLNQQLDQSDKGGETNEIVSDVDQNLKEVIDQIRDIDFERLELQYMSRMSAGDPGSGVTADASGTAFGGLTRAEAAAMAFGGLILGTIEGLGQIAAQGSGPFASAGSLAETGAPRTRVAL